MNKLQIVYDFDGTLTPKSVPMFQILKENGWTEEEFELAIHKQKNKFDSNIYLSWFSTFLKVCNSGKIKPTKDNISLGVKDINYNPGVETFFLNVNNIAKDENVDLKHYIVSSSIKDFLKKTSISSYIDKIYATEFKYDENGCAYKIDYLATDIKKVDSIKKINILNNKDELDCTNLVYIGDGLTDYYAMEFVKNNNGISILLTHNDNQISNKLLNVANAVFMADYSINSELFSYIEMILKKTNF